MERISVTNVDSELVKQFDKLCKDRGYTRSTVIKLLMEKFVKTKKI